MNLDNVKIILSINDNSKDELLTILLENAANTICVYINADKLPEKLNFVAEELAVARYRKIGSEGVSTEKIDVVTTTYSVNDLSRYKDILEMHKENKTGGRKVKML